MRNSILLVAFLGSFCNPGANAIMSLLGDKVDHPLVFWEHRQFASLIQPGTPLVYRCVLSRGMAVVKHYQAIVSCFPANSHVDATSHSSICRATSGVPSCYHDKAQEFADICDFTEEDRQRITDGVRNNEDLTHALCCSGAKALERYADFGGFECARIRHDSLVQCSNTTNLPSFPMYNEDGCRNVYAYVDCVANEIKECQLEAGEIVEEIMKAGLQGVCQAVEGYSTLNKSEYNSTTTEESIDATEEDTSYQNRTKPVEGSGMLPPNEHNSTSTEESVDVIEGHDANCQNQTKVEELMETQTDLLRDIKDLLQTVVQSLSKHEDLLQSIADD